jgi:tRNA(Ile)-lysidine synthase
MVLDAASIDRFSHDLAALIAPSARVGVAVSGGPDSMALLLLAAAARPGNVEAATVDHALRPESHNEARLVGGQCDRLSVGHRILTVEWDQKPQTAIQEKARLRRYGLLSDWARERNLDAVATAHHLDDQAETFVMRLNRGAGVRGLAGMRPSGTIPGGRLPLVRPLLGWRRAELEAVCSAAGVDTVADPSNEDDQFERVRVRQALANAAWLDRTGLATSANNLRHAHAALNWAAAREWQYSVFEIDGEILYRVTDAPSEIRRRIVARAVARLATEGRGTDLRGRELEQLLQELGSGGKATIRGVLCTGGSDWRFSAAPPRRR